MLTNTELLKLKNQVPNEYKYFFEWHKGDSDYEDYLTDGAPDLDKIKEKHLWVLEEHAYWEYQAEHNYYYVFVHCLARSHSLVERYARFISQT